MEISVPAMVLSTAAALREALAEFDAAILSGADCARFAEQLAATEKACGSARLLAVARAVDAEVYRELGFRNGPAWLAHQTGSTGGHARQELETAFLLQGCPVTLSAARAGEVSLAQAGEIVRAEREMPGSEDELLAVARESDLGRLRDAARERRLATADVDELHAAQRAERHFRHWRDRLGMVRFSGALTPEVGVALVNRVEQEADRARRNARADGEAVEPFQAHAADALAALVGGSGGDRGRRSTRADLVLVCDLNAYRRGHAHPGEASHVVGGGPLPVSLVRDLGRDAFLKVVLHDGVEVHTVKHFGRHLPAELRTALDLGPVPAFTGAQCHDCGSRFGLQYDHVVPVANGGPTSYENLQPLCWRDHQDKTERDRKVGLLGHGPP